MKEEAKISKKVLITGCNKGIGFAILKTLAKRNEKHSFIMAIRDLNRGKQALESLLHDIPDLKDRTELTELDVSNSASIMKAIQNLENKNIKIDCLINNAAISYDDVFNVTEDRVKNILHTNFYGTVELTASISHLINDNGKIIILGSVGGSLDIFTSEKLIQEFEDPNLTMLKLFNLAQKYYLDVKNNIYLKEGWSKFMYGVTKILIHHYGKLIGSDPLYLNRNIQVYSCHPGVIETDMTKGIPDIMKSPLLLPLEEGARGPCYLFDLPWTVNVNQGCLFNICEKVSFRPNINLSDFFK